MMCSFTLTACKGNDNDTPHTCESKCSVCQLCMDDDCADSACSNKCQGHGEQHTCESVCPTCNKCMDATCTEALCTDKCLGHTPASHTCESVCPTCGNCTDSTCTEEECEEKCEGHGQAYVNEKNIEHLKGVNFNQSDVIKTVIKCQNGEMVTITLGTSLPRYYSRGFLVEGMKGLICEENQSVYLESEFKEECWSWKENFNNIGKYYEKYEHKRWLGYTPGKEDHGGIDALVFEGFFEALRENKPMPIDVYDYATWASISVLSEQSLATGQIVTFPDFTDGKWILRENTFEL